MGRAILLTGKPGCGKTTVLQRVIARLEIPMGGFYTREIRQGNQRQGFELVTLDGQRRLLAHTSIRSPQRVGKYGVDVGTLDDLAVGAIRKALAAGGLVVIDEIGPMEIASRRFREAVFAALESPSTLLGAIVQRNTPFTDAVKRHSGVSLIEVRSENREGLPDYILGLIEEQ